MSDLVTKVADAIAEHLDGGTVSYPKASRAAIKAVAEWLEKSGSMQAAIVGNALLEQLEGSE